MTLIRAGLCFVAIIFLLMPMHAGAQLRDCAADVSDLSDMIACFKDAYRPLRENCQKAPESGWRAPIEGRRVLDFSEKTQYGTLSKGIVYEAQHADAARAPIDATVLYAGEFRSYGKLVILDGCGVDLLILGLDALSVRGGEVIQAQAELGRMAPNIGRGLPVLYFEVRVAGRVTDPNPYLK